MNQQDPELSNKLKSQLWRLNNLYWITDKEGKVVQFKLNWGQLKLFKFLWCLNIILKARQIGFTTFLCILFLDACLFCPNVRAGIIAHGLSEAKTIFRDKIKFAYNNLPIEIRNNVRAVTDRGGELMFSNGSSLAVATSFRSGTVQYLHISEFGKICRKYPDRAKEIITGALQAVETGQFVFIESTAEGRGGAFFDFCQTAEKLAQAGRKLTPMDYRLHFFPWYRNPSYTLDPDGVPIPGRNVEYFEELESKHGIKLTPGQKAWWTKKHATLGEDIFQEYPATVEEAFRASVQGAYFTTQFKALRKDGRITSLPIEDAILVDTWWDIGINDTNAIWFTQNVGGWVHVIDYYEASGEGLEYYETVLRNKEYRYGRHVGPHDLGHRDWSTGKTRVKSALDLGLKFEVVPRVNDKQDSIEAARNFFAKCIFDEERCDEGLMRLENYRKEWDDRLATFKKRPLHDENSNGADAFQTLAMGHEFRSHRRAKPVAKAPANKGWT